MRSGWSACSPRWRSQELSPAAAWTLAVIALKQPVTLNEINAQRGGVDSSAALQTLRTRGLIARAAKLGPRREKLWYTTAHFLEVYGLASLDELRQQGTKERIFPTLFNDLETEDGPPATADDTAQPGESF